MTEQSPLRERLRTALSGAIKSRDRDAVSALRSALAAVDNAEAVPADSVPARSPGATDDEPSFAGSTLGVGAAEAERAQLTEGDIEQIVRAEVAERAEAALDYDRHERPEQAARLRAEAATLSTVLDVTGSADSSNS